MCCSTSSCVEWCIKRKSCNDLQSSYKKQLAQLATYSVDISAERIVVDDNIITSANSITAMKVAFTLLEMLTSPDNTVKIKDLIDY